ncbi:hypothetical protein [Pseudoalteromonas umbrosa]|uniref:hypothetical protein n=1 Tax=Pseudoalteromonas umbrosa TaxID=3048489 RepID=UPI0024C30E82|nr:hypothetical protein [Pseudoalteromonas sp. B95]MDK1286655.1 hypothetical protein [Pseudoalteromonas sp. B95]
MQTLKERDIVSGYKDGPITTAESVDLVEKNLPSPSGHAIFVKVKLIEEEKETTDVELQGNELEKIYESYPATEGTSELADGALEFFPEKNDHLKSQVKTQNYYTYNRFDQESKYNAYGFGYGRGDDQEGSDLKWTESLRWTHKYDFSGIGHTSLVDSNETDGDATAQVVFAGQLEWDNSKLSSWDNRSGHYRASDADNAKAGFPLGIYKSYIGAVYEGNSKDIRDALLYTLRGHYKNTVRTVGEVIKLTEKLSDQSPFYEWEFAGAKELRDVPDELPIAQDTLHENDFWTYLDDTQVSSEESIEKPAELTAAQISFAQHQIKLINDKIKAVVANYATVDL